METEIDLITAKHKAGEILSNGEIRTLMNYALELLREFRAETEASIDRAKKILAERCKSA